jgi:hypothetical protein
LAFNFKGIRKVIKILIFILDLTIILISFSSKHLEDVKKNLIFPQFFGYIAIYLVPVGGQLCVLGEYLLLVF